MATWTKKHHEFCLANGIRMSCLDLYQYLVRRTGGLEPEEIFLDLKDFWDWMAKKSGRRMDRKTLKSAIRNLAERSQGIVTIVRQYSWHYFQILIKPVAFFSFQKTSPKWEVPPEARGSEERNLNGCPALGEKQQQQNLDLVDRICKAVGLRYDRSALSMIWRLAGRSIDRIKQAIELMLYRHSTEEIAKPHGFLVKALKYNWQDGFDLYYQPELPKFNSLSNLRQFVNNLWASA